MMGREDNSMKKIISIIMLALALVLAVCCYGKLPKNVIIQVGFNGQAANTCPKFLAIVVPLGISAAGSIMNLAAKKKEKALYLPVRVFSF